MADKSGDKTHMRGRVHSLMEELRLDFTSSEDSEIISLPDISKKHPRLYKSIRRDHDMMDLGDPHIVELMRKGTIPPSLSLRAPPTHIGTSQHRNDVLGITKEEVSKRYIVKLQRERVRNNEAVYRSLDNLPIKIRQVAQNSYDKNLKSPTLSSKSRERDYYQPDSSPEAFSTHQYAKPLEPLWSKNNSINHRKQKAKVKISPKGENPFDVDKSRSDDETRHVTFEPHTLNMIHSELPYIFSGGFQGYQSRIRFSRRKPTAFGQSVNNHQDFQKRYKRVLDSDQQPHFIKSSFITGQRLNNTSSYHRFKTISNRYEQEKDEGFFAIKSVQQINQPFMFASPASPTRVPNPSLYSECQNSDTSLHVNDFVMSPRSASSTVADIDSCDNISHGEEDNELQDADKNIKSESKVMKGGTHNNTTSNIPVLSLELLRVHENATCAQTKKTQSACNLTDITEREESDLTKTSRSEIGHDMKISVRINYKSKEDVIEEHNTTLSASSGKSRDNLSTKQLRPNHSSESRKSGSTLSDQPLDYLRVEGHLCGEKSDVDRRNIDEDTRNIVNIKKNEIIPPSAKNEIPKIIVDLNRLTTISTPVRAIKSKNEHINNDKREPKRGRIKPETKDQSEFIQAQTDQRSDFFLTYDEGDSPLSHYDTSASPQFDEIQGLEIKGVKNTPRTEIDDSGISISTFENEAIKC